MTQSHSQIVLLLSFFPVQNNNSSCTAKMRWSNTDSLETRSDVNWKGKAFLIYIILFISCKITVSRLWSNILMFTSCGRLEFWYMFRFQQTRCFFMFYFLLQVYTFFMQCHTRATIVHTTFSGKKLVILIFLGL